MADGPRRRVEPHGLASPATLLKLLRAFRRPAASLRHGVAQTLTKDRLLPIGARAAAWLGKYLEEARPKLVVEPDEREVFLCVSGRGLTPGVLGNLVHGYINASSVNKSGSCHLFHHAMATLMLENGADLRYVQQMLGHARLNTTEIYTHVNIQKLIEVHRLSHPAKAPDNEGGTCKSGDGSDSIHP